MNLRNIYCLIALCLSMLLWGCGAGQSYRKATGSTWGTVYNITYNSDRDLSDSIVEQMAIIDRTLSPFCEGSEVSRFNSGEDVVMGQEVAEVFGLSQQVARLSGGNFDPTVAPLVNLWGFGYKDRKAEMPSAADIDSALATVGILDCHLEPSGVIVRKHRDTELNFSAIAKGYGVDRIAAMLRRNGCTDYMVEVGGEIAVSGMNSRRSDWHIQVDAPVESDGVVDEKLLMLSITDAGIATSGNYRNYRDVAPGQRVAHTISPLTGRPVASPVLSVTVIAKSTALADALATACMAMEPGAAEKMIADIGGVEALMVFAAPDSGKFITKCTPGFDRYIIK